ncbi:MAG: hypothetical protein AAF481_12075 [Acidobacteriota bacterium]
MSRWSKLLTLVAVAFAAATFSSVALGATCDATCNDGFEFEITVQSNMECMQALSTYCYYRGGGWAVYTEDGPSPELPGNVGDLNLEDLLDGTQPVPGFCDDLRVASQYGGPVPPLQDDAAHMEATPTRQG